MVTSSKMAEVIKNLLVSHHRIEAMIGAFPPLLMIPDRVDTYEADLLEINERFTEFSALVLTYSKSFLNMANLYKTSEGVVMDLSWWEKAMRDLQSKVDSHNMEIRNVSSGLYHSKPMSEYERLIMEIKKKQLELSEKCSVRAQEKEKRKCQGFCSPQI